jgi:hypothetical protein
VLQSGILLVSLGILGIVLVANGRWPNVWNAALGVTGQTYGNETPSVTSLAGTPIPGSTVGLYGGTGTLPTGATGYPGDQ